MTKKILLLLIALICGALSLDCSGSREPPNILLLPQYLSIDATNSRLFVVDAANNGFSLIDLTTNAIVGDAPLLNQDGPLFLPQLPQDIAVMNLGNGITRIFIIGNSPPPSNTMYVLEYNSVTGLAYSPIHPITVGTNPNALLSGLKFDPNSGNLFVSDSSDAQVRVYNATTGAEVAGSPVAVNPSPAKMGLNTSVNRLFVSSLGGTNISVIDTTNLAAGATSVDVLIDTGSVASATNASGTVLFALSPTLNQISVFNFNVAANTVTAIGTPIVPPVVGQPVPTNNVLSGAAVQVAAAPLSTGLIAGVITQSTGDLGFVDVAADLSGFAAQGLVQVLNGQGATGIDILKDASGNGTVAYFAAPGGSAVSFVDILGNVFIGQDL